MCKTLLNNQQASNLTVILRRNYPNDQKQNKLYFVTWNQNIHTSG